MPPQIPSPNRRIPVEHLTPAAFASFGTVVQNPSHAPSTAGFQSLQAVQANQGSALKYLDVTHLDNHYNLAPSRKPAKAVMNMFVCSPRTLEAADGTASQPAEQSGSADSDMGGAVRMVRAFIANGTQAVTYGPGTWHAPMVVLGAKSIDFVVVQYANGVGLEDCQEVEFKPEGGAEGINVVIDDGAFDQNMFHRAKL
ncbi:hypothetical protein H2203_007526 [Taxawa tesnikishii (nom. ined.)]|nr:hypothetical protein H2203_007526 [Dothideales sp. JES 119]